ncbi:MAG: murein biosynthesis integral membrane protein MurJ [Ahrensia sp.]|nr:murein biosynthesis integral membrane protein MurJ [Ahrensia sp.]
MKGLFAKFATVGGATMASRLLGFVRDALIGRALGTGPFAEAFVVAFALPNLFRRIFAEGAFNTAFVPLFAKKLEGEDISLSRVFAEQVVSVLVPVLIVLSALAIVAMPVIIFLTNPFWLFVDGTFVEAPPKFDYAVVYGRIMFPYLFCMSLVAMLSGVLNSLRRYFIAAFVPVLLNIILVATVATALFLGIDQYSTGLWLSWGVFVAGFVQLLLLVWATRREGYAIWPKRPVFNEDIRKLLRLMGPAVLTGGVIQINLVVGQIIASAQDGARALLYYADRLNQLPLGLIGIAVGIVLLPELSRALKAERVEEAANLQDRSLEFAFGLTLPAAVAFITMPVALVSIVFEGGAFTRGSSITVAHALAAFASGLPAYVLIKVFQPAFFAREDMRTPFRFSVVMVVVNVVGSIILFPLLGHIGIALATSLSAWVNLGLLVFTLNRRGEFQPSRETKRRLVIITVSSAAMGAAILVLQNWLSASVFSFDIFERLVAVGAIVAVAAGLYAILVLATGAVDRRQLLAMMRRG